jgi:hypothetical protein
LHGFFQTHEAGIDKNRQMDVSSSFSELLHIGYVILPYALLQLGDRHAFALLFAVWGQSRATSSYPEPVPDHPAFVADYPDGLHCRRVLKDSTDKADLYSGSPLQIPSSSYRFAAQGASRFELNTLFPSLRESQLVIARQTYNNKPFYLSRNPGILDFNSQFSILNSFNLLNNEKINDTYMPAGSVCLRKPVRQR